MCWWDYKCWFLFLYILVCTCDETFFPFPESESEGEVEIVAELCNCPKCIAARAATMQQAVSPVTHFFHLISLSFYLSGRHPYLLRSCFPQGSHSCIYGSSCNTPLQDSQIKKTQIHLVWAQCVAFVHCPPIVLLCDGYRSV